MSEREAALREENERLRRIDWNFEHCSTCHNDDEMEAEDRCCRLLDRAEAAEARAERAEMELEDKQAALDSMRGWVENAYGTGWAAMEAERDAYKKALEDEANRSCRADGCPPKTFGRCGHQFARAVLAALAVSETTKEEM